jgi:drug/metabolite transporter (DMT)-like permease
VALPVLLTGGFRMSLATLPLIVLTGITEVVGYAFYALGSRSDIAVTAVLASMFAPIAAVAAFVLFRERLAGRQVIGIALVVAGVAILGWLAA